MSLPRGWLKGGVFVCLRCAEDADRENAIKADARMASGRLCVTCGETQPYEAKVRILPDGAHSVHAAHGLKEGERIVVMERQEFTLFDESVLVYVDIGTQREVGLRVTPSGALSVWVHDDPYGDAAEPSARWEYDPDRWCAYEGCQERPVGYDAESEEHYCAKHEGPW